MIRMIVVQVNLGRLCRDVEVQVVMIIEKLREICVI